MLDSIIKRNIIFISFGILVIFLLLVDTAGYNIKIQYGETQEYGQAVPPISGVMVTSKEAGEVSVEEVANDKYLYGSIHTSQWIRNDNHIDIIFSGQDETIPDLLIEGIKFRFLFFNLFTITRDNFADNIQISDAAYADDNCIIIPFEDNTAKIHFESTDIINNSHIKKKAEHIRAVLCLIIVLFIFLFFMLDHKCRTSEDAAHYKWVAILGIILFLIMISVNYGTQYCSPDEHVSAGAVRYYYDHWGLPNFNDDSVLESFSVYGNSRLKELTPYYFLAGKVGVVVDKTIGAAFSYRYLNFILFFILVGLFVRYGRNNKWMLFGLICTPQLYYIFTYTTSDAWDYFISYICVMFITLKILKEKRGSVLNYAVAGILLALIFLGKSTFYPVIVYIAVIYAIEVSGFDKVTRKDSVKKSLIALASFACIVLARKGLDYLYYGGNKNAIIRAVGSSVRSYYPVSYIERGTTLYGMITDTDMCDRLFKSFFGVYGWMRFDGEDIYYKIILLLNVSLIAYILFMLLKDKDKQVRFEAVVWVGVAVSMIIAVVYHCWAVDYQPQGRYLFGILPCWMHLASKRKVYDRVTAEYLLEAIALVSIFSFVRYGMIRFVA